jgi:hypothetical protein
LAAAITPLSFTASQIGTFEDCPARFYHAAQHYPSGVLQTDRTAADVGSAIHDALMALHQQIEREYLRGTPIERRATWQRLQTLLEARLRFLRLNAAHPQTGTRLAAAERGLQRAVDLIIDEMPHWLFDPQQKQLLVWVENPLNHGAGIAGVELESGCLVRTRPDVIGLRLDAHGCCRPLVRDFKAKGRAVDPAFDTGIGVRALWMLSELQEPRCPWFMRGRALDVDVDGIDVETVNLLHGDDDEFVVRATLSEQDLIAVRRRLLETIRAMATVLATETANTVPASPGDFCLAWCGYLAFCPPGRDHVRKYAGEEALNERLATA